MKRAMLFLSLAAALAACKSKSKSGDQPGSGSGSGSAVATASVDAAVAAQTVKVPTGRASFGCLGWNAKAKSAACITGEDAMGEEPRFQIDYVNGTEPATKLAIKDGNFDDSTAANATLAKLGMEPFPSPVKTVKSPQPGDTDLGEGARLVWSEKIMDEGGDNQAPTTAHEAYVTCANKQQVELDKVEQEGIDLDFYVWSVPGHVVIEEETHIGREGESRTMRKAVLLELATCKLVDASS